MPQRKNVSKKSDVGNVSVVCTIHNPSIPTSQFIPFQNMRGTAKEKLDNLISICDKRLREPIESPYRMTAVFAQIPSIIDNAYLGKLGYHKQWYIHFIKNTHRCQADQSSTVNEKLEIVLRVKGSQLTHCFLLNVHCVERKIVAMIQS